MKIAIAITPTSDIPAAQAKRILSGDKETSISGIEIRDVISVFRAVVMLTLEIFRSKNANKAPEMDPRSVP
jgi:hypothetical protein